MICDTMGEIVHDRPGIKSFVIVLCGSPATYKRYSTLQGSEFQKIRYHTLVYNTNIEKIVTKSLIVDKKDL